MQRLPLSTPGRNAPDTPLVRLSRQLGTHPYAVALATCGFRVTADALVGDFGEELTWWVEDRPSEAQDLCAAWEAGRPADPEKAPAVRFAACMAALCAYAALQHWTATGGSGPVWRQRGQFLEPGPGFPWPSSPGVAAVEDLPLAAAFVAVGFFPIPQLIQTPSGRPAIPLPAESCTFPALTLQACAEAIQRPASGIVAPITLPGFPPEEHPFLYALQALMNLPGFADLQKAAGKAPRVALRSRFSQRSAIVSAEAVREGRKDTAAFRDRLRRHLSA
jgi:hypothetical protein